MAHSNFDLIKENILTRRSVFQKDFKADPISKEVLLDLLACADAAPTHKKTQPWRFTIFLGEGKKKLAESLANVYTAHTDPEKFLEKSRDAMYNKAMDSAAVIAICIRYSGAVPAWEEVAATGAAVQNIWLAAAAHGIGGYWGSPAGIIKHAGEFLALEEGEECLGFFYMGHHELPAQGPNRSPLESKIRWEE